MTAKTVSVITSIVSRICCRRADSSIPTQQIQVMTTIQATPIASTPIELGPGLAYQRWKV